MKTYYIYMAVYMVFSLTACITASITRKKFKNTPLILAPAILWMGFTAESTGILHNQLISYHSGWIFNIYGFFFTLLFCWLIYKYLKSERRKRTARFIIAITLTVYAIRFFTLESFSDRMIYIQMLELIAYVSLSLLYMIELFKSDQPLVFKDSPHFFFILGYLFFYIVYTPLNVVFDLKLHVFSGEFYITLKGFQAYALMLMNAFFIFGFIWTRPVTQTR